MQPATLSAVELPGFLRSPAVVAAFALLCVGAGCVVGSLWLGAEERVPAKLGDAPKVLAAFEKEHRPDQ